MKSAKHLPSRPLVASQYDDGDDDECGTSENRLRFWLKLEQWSLNEAAAILCYIEPDSVKWSVDTSTQKLQDTHSLCFGPKLSADFLREFGSVVGELERRPHTS